MTLSPWGYNLQYRRNLPHIEPLDRDCFLTYRLADSIPIPRLLELEALYRECTDHDLKAKRFLDYDEVLDLNGPYHLRETEVRELVKESLSYLDGSALHLWAYTIMPNHVHACCKVLDLSRPLFRIMQSHKRFTGRLGNKALGLHGEFWQRETYDHVIREGRFAHAVRYILNNPVKAGFVKHWRDWPGTYLAPDCYGFEDV